MKKKKKTVNLPADAAGLKELPLELVVTTTLHFLGEDRNPTEPRLKLATNHAISFLEFCMEQIEGQKKGAIRRAENLEEFESLGWKPSDKVSYKDGIKFITGQQRSDRAQDHYKAYKENNMFLPKRLTASELKTALERDEKEGFVVQWLPLQRNAFEMSRSAGLLGLKRHKKLPKRT